MSQGACQNMTLCATHLLTVTRVSNDILEICQPIIATDKFSVEFDATYVIREVDQIMPQKIQPVPRTIQ